jgi:hypothetical protein
MTDGAAPVLLTLAVTLFIEVLRAVAWCGVALGFYLLFKPSE